MEEEYVLPDAEEVLRRLLSVNLEAIFAGRMSEEGVEVVHRFLHEAYYPKLAREIGGKKMVVGQLFLSLVDVLGEFLLTPRRIPLEFSDLKWRLWLAIIVALLPKGVRELEQEFCREVAA